MPHFVKIPNLPSGRIELVAAGEDYAEEIGNALLPFGIKTLVCEDNSFVDARLRSHIDLSVFHQDENSFVLSQAVSNSEFAKKLRLLGAEITVSTQKQSSDYPKDAILCALSNGDRIFHNKKCCDKSITDTCGDSFIHVNQGYAKCAVCLVSKTAAITSDSGLAEAMTKEGIDVLKIAPGGIMLSGFEEGFIGGASFKISSDIIAFTGNLNSHPSKSDIECFLRLHGVTPIYLTDRPIFDIGSVVPVTEF